MYREKVETKGSEVSMASTKGIKLLLYILEK